jgi:hypothetical protein
MEVKTRANWSADYLSLISYVAEQPDGALLEYAVVEDATGVQMDRRGRSKLRQAIRYLRRECAVIVNVGYHLAVPGMVRPLMAHRLLKVDNAVLRADRTRRVLQERFWDDLPESDRQQFLLQMSALGTIKLAMENGRRVYLTVKDKSDDAGPTINVPVIE